MDQHSAPKVETVVDADEMGAASGQYPAPTDYGERSSLVREHTSRMRENARARLVAGLLLLLGVISVGSIAVVAFRMAPIDELKDVLALIFAPLLGVFGAAVTGYYYSVSK